LINHLDWRFLMQDVGDGRTYLGWLLSAWGWTLTVSGFSLIVATFCGSLMGILRTMPNKGLALIGNIWTELFRNIPLLVQIFLWYHVIPSIFPILRGVPSLVLVIFALGFFTSARISELVRSGIESIPKGQRYAGLAMGLTLPQTYRYVLLPVAFRIVIPPLTSEAMTVIKNSSVAFVVSISELTLYALQVQEETSRGIEVYVMVTLLYSISAFMVSRLSLWVEHRVQVPGVAGSLR
jgi:glutamate/aspartate transport system permease protein